MIFSQMIIKTQALYPGSQGYSLLRVTDLDVEMCLCVLNSKLNLSWGMESTDTCGWHESHYHFIQLYIGGLN